MFPDGFDPPTLCVSSTRDTTTPRKHFKSFFFGEAFVFFFCCKYKHETYRLIHSFMQYLCLYTNINKWVVVQPSMCYSPHFVILLKICQKYFTYIHNLHVFCIAHNILKHFLYKYYVNLYGIRKNTGIQCSNMIIIREPYLIKLIKINVCSRPLK